MWHTGSIWKDGRFEERTIHESRSISSLIVNKPALLRTSQLQSSIQQSCTIDVSENKACRDVHIDDGRVEDTFIDDMGK